MTRRHWCTFPARDPDRRREREPERERDDSDVENTAAGAAGDAKFSLDSLSRSQKDVLLAVLSQLGAGAGGEVVAAAAVAAAAAADGGAGAGRGAAGGGRSAGGVQEWIVRELREVVACGAVEVGSELGVYLLAGMLVLIVVAGAVVEVGHRYPNAVAGLMVPDEGASSGGELLMLLRRGLKLLRPVLMLLRPV